MIADPFTWLFGQIVRARNASYDSKRARVCSLGLPVISVGNLSVGGSGKTPFVQALGRWLNAQNIPFDIISRGYGRKSRGVLEVDPAGPADLYGDEPLLLARSLKAPVFVGEKRYETGLAAEEFASKSPRPAQLHILDDGFQHRRLHRDFDIVLLAHGDLQGSPLPFGRLREPLSSLGRAHAVVAPADLAGVLARPDIWYMQRRVVLPERAPTRPIAFCGLARPKQFWQSLADIGISPVRTFAFRDHHRYSAKDIALLQGLAKQHGANGFLTTEKDLVKLDSSELSPLVAPALMIEVENADARFSSMLDRVGVR